MGLINRKSILCIIILGIFIAFGLNGEKLCAASIIDSGTCSRNINWELNSDYTLTLTTSGVASKISDRPWDQYKDRIKEVVIGSNITEIAESSFMNYEKLEKVQLPNNNINYPVWSKVKKLKL